MNAGARQIVSKSALTTKAATGERVVGAGGGLEGEDHPYSSVAVVAKSSHAGHTNMQAFNYGGENSVISPVQYRTAPRSGTGPASETWNAPRSASQLVTMFG